MTGQESLRAALPCAHLLCVLKRGHEGLHYTTTAAIKTWRRRTTV